MMRFLMTLLFATFMLGMQAQSVDEGIKYAYYGRFKSAEEALTKQVAANAADARAQYWLGQVFIENPDQDLAKAKDVYTKAMTATNSNPLILVGMGHIDLLEGRAAEAKTKFDQAIAATTNRKGKGDADILRAVARANADGASNIGDPMYGIEKANQAIALDPKNPEAYVSLGILQLKRGPEYGGEAKRAFDIALEQQPNYSRALFRIGKIFESQKNPDQYLDYYSRAVSNDPAYAPGYLELYNYYSNRDVNKAKEYLDKYMANADVDRETNYFYADYLFRAGRYQESLDKAKEIEANLNGVKYPKVNKLYAFNYDRLGDSIKAMQYMETYMNTQVKDKINGEDFAMMAAAYAKVPGNSVKADEYFAKALDTDTAMASKISIAKDAADMYGKSGNYADQFKWLTKKAELTKQKGDKVSETDYYYWADAGLKAEDFVKAEQVAKEYVQMHPDKPQPYIFRVRAAVGADADTSKGTAIEAIDEQNKFYMQDTARNKNRIINNYGYKVYYYANKSREYEKAIAVLDDILALDPGNSYATDAKKQLQAILNKKNGGTPSASSGKSSAKKPVEG